MLGALDIELHTNLKNHNNSELIYYPTTHILGAHANLYNLEFAIDFFHSKGKKSIYCSPIKSLSNQKFYDFTQKYPHISVGLITGDIKTNSAAKGIGDGSIITTYPSLLQDIKGNSRVLPLDAGAYNNQ